MNLTIRQAKNITATDGDRQMQMKRQQKTWAVKQPCHMKSLLLFLITCVFCLSQKTSYSKAQIVFCAIEDSTLYRTYDSLCRVNADSILLVHVKFSDIESKGVISWKIDGKLFGKVFRIKKNIVSYEEIDKVSILARARQIYFSKESSFSDTIHNAKWPASHEFWIDYRSYSQKTESVHFVNSTDVIFGPSNSMVEATELFYDLSAEKYSK